MISRPKFSCGRVRVFSGRRASTSIAGSFATSISRSRKLPVANSRNSWIWPGWLPARLGWLASIIRVARSVADRAGDLAVGGREVVVPEERHLLFSGRCEWTMRNSQRCRASLITVLGEKLARAS